MRKLAVAAGAFSAAVFLSRYLLPMGILPYAAAVILCAAIACTFAIKGEKRLWAVIPLAGLAVGLFWDFGYNAVFYSPAEKLDGETMPITAVVSDFPEATAYGEKVVVKLQLDDAPNIKTQLYFYGHAPELRPGDTVSVTARLSLSSNIYGDENSYFSSRGVFLFASAENEPEITPGRMSVLHYFPQYIARAMKNCIDKIFPEDMTGFFRALLLGDKIVLKESVSTVQALRTTGTYHIIAVSGMHVSFFAGFLVPLLGKKRGSYVAIPLIWVFAAVTGFLPSVVRAAFMQTVVLAAPLLKRESDSLTSLFAALALLLIINPISAENAGLQFSFAATLGLVLFSGRISSSLTNASKKIKRLSSKKISRILHALISAFASTFGASVFTIPLTALYFGYVSLISILANILILWAVSAAFMLGMIACLIGFILAPLGSIIAFISAIPARFMLGLVRLLAQSRFAAIYVSNTYVVWWLVYIYVLGIFAVSYRIKLRQMLYPAGAGAVCLCVVLLIAAIRTDGRSFEMTVLDVGQGQSIVLTSGSATAVIDCGSSSGESAGDIASEYIMGLGRTRVDLLILTHFHADHCNGLDELFDRVDVTVMAVPSPEETETGVADEVLSLAERSGTEIIYVTETTRSDFGLTQLTMFAPVGTESENERGLSMVITAGMFDTVITGDMSSESERLLSALYDLPDSEVLIVGHHGSKYSTSQDFLDDITPEMAIISVGENSYGHPTKEVLDRLSDRGIAVYRTDEAGNIVISGKKRSPAA